MYERYKQHIRHQKSYYKNHSYNRAISRFDYSRKEVAEILSLIKKGKYVNKLVFRGRIVYDLWFNNDQVRVVYDPKLKQIVTFLYDNETFEELDNTNYEKGLDENFIS